MLLGINEGRGDLNLLHRPKMVLYFYCLSLANAHLGDNMQVKVRNNVAKVIILHILPINSDLYSERRVVHPHPERENVRHRFEIRSLRSTCTTNLAKYKLVLDDSPGTVRSVQCEMARFPIFIFLWRLYVRQCVVLNALIIQLYEELRYWVIMYSLYFCGIPNPTQKNSIPCRSNTLWLKCWERNGQHIWIAIKGDML